MADRRTDSSPQSTWITMEHTAPDSAGSGGDSESDSGADPLRGSTARIFRDGHPMRGPAAAFLRAYNRGELMHIRRHSVVLGGDDDEESHDEDEGDEELHGEDEGETGDEGIGGHFDMLYRGELDSFGPSDTEMHVGMDILHEGDDVSNSDEVSHEEGDEDEDEDDEHHSQYSREDNAMASYEDLPSLTALSPARRARGSSRRSQSKDKGSRSPFIPKYLEDTAYGAMYNRHALDSHKKQLNGRGAAANGSSSTIAAAEAECDLAVPHVAPDMFFKTLVQDTWPHYCTPVPTMPTFASLGYGLGINESIYAALPHSTNGSSESTQSQSQAQAQARRGAATSEDTGTTSWRARLISQRPAAGGSVLSRQQSSLIAQGQAQQRRAAVIQGKEDKAPERTLQLPSEWSTAKRQPNLEISPDRVTVKYTGPGRRDTDAAMILADVCIPTRTGVYYFEVYIKSRGQSGYIGIGLSRAGLLSTRLPGWDPGSWGYHGDDGHGFAGAGSGSRYGPRYSTGDTVGCGVDFMKRRIFFTRNGVFLGYAFQAIETDKDLYPCVGMRTPGEHVMANFGRKPFTFDISGYVAAAREDALKMVKNTELRALLPSHKAMEASAADDKSDMGQMAGILSLRGGLAAGIHRPEISEGDATLSIVLMHLLHNEYYATARALIENAIGQHGLDSATSPQLAAVLESLSQQDQQRVTRRRICKHICDGDIDHALGLLQDAYPQVLEDESLVFQLRCRQFIELARAANGYHIADSVPSDDSSLATPLSPRPRTADDMMDVDDSQSTAVLSLAAITNAPTGARNVKFGQLGSLSKMDPAQLVRVLLEYGRQLQADYGSSPNAIIREGLVHTFSLLAYADPAQSPIAALLDPSACRPLARLVEMAIMATEKAPRMSSLECICRQAGALLSELSARRNGVAALISVERDVLGLAGVGDADEHEGL
ncbi:hypothetical protein IWW50_004673 [Coemansia erecta]|nr:hypothetical protein IWW50_004673 [Coemansia erecta]